MKKLLVRLFVLFSLAFSTNRVPHSTKVMISPDSQLFIKGSTNVNTFTCDFNIKQLNTPIPLHYQEIDNKLVFDKARLILDNTCFDCGHKVMNKDFMDLLKSDEHPEILMGLKEIHPVNTMSSVVNATVELSIAGITKSYNLPLHISVDDQINVAGNLKLNITDFGLEAPKKALGLIKVSEDIEIHLQMYFTELKY